MPQTKRDVPKSIVRVLYRRGYSLQDIAGILKVTSCTVRNRMLEWGLDRRNAGSSLRGRKQTPEHVAARVTPLIGRPLSQVTRQKISEAATGRAAWNKGLSKDANPGRVTYGKCGSQHWNWKGGVSGVAIRLRQSSPYKKWRTAVFQRDEWTCQGCGVRGGDLRAHHLVKFSTILQLPIDMLNDLIWAVENGMTFCNDCHKEVHHG